MLNYNSQISDKDRYPKTYEIRQKLTEAINKEDYELASKLRDEINKTDEPLK
jgi:protein-arginine kinase activator protein McsA